MQKAGLLRKKVVAKKKDLLDFSIDCSQPIDDGVFVPEDFETFLKQRIKVDGHKGNLGDTVSVKVDRSNISVRAQAPFSKRYLKYLTKKYLKKNQLREYLHVVANPKDRKGYQVRYFNIQAGEGEQE